ncbi:MAG TPA: DUF938 domain-containing protein [Rhizomicrobium sp.]|nr:DUF938 domain-containing protein [Rhizomicrobium sp.]
MSDLRITAPAAARNRGPILEVMRRVFPPAGKVLEIASGSGEHVVHFAAAMPGLSWQPSDPDGGARASIAAWTAHENLANISAPLNIDVREDVWGVENDAPFDAITAINMIHISPWESTLGLFAGAARLLKSGGIVFLYGPYKRGGAHTAPSNEVFEGWLKGLDSRYGVRDLADVTAVAENNGFAMRETIAMPANNFVVIFAKI